MKEDADEEQLLREVTLQSATSIFLARQRAEEELLRTKEALELKTQELAQSLAMLRATLESTTDGILVTDGGGRVTDFNRKYADMWRLPPEIVASPEHRQLLEVSSRQLGDSPSFLARVEEIYAASPPESYDLLELADGRVFERFSRIQQVEGRTVGRVWSFRDVTERQRAEEALRELFAREKAARAEAEATQQRLAKALQHERHIVRTLAESFLGRTPTLPGLQFAHIYEPASKTERMGGDYFDYIRLDSQRLALVIGDVCGKGLPAAAYTAMAKYMLRAYSKEQAEPKEVLARLNQALYEEMADEAMFITLFYGVLEMGSFNLTYVNAGHPAPVLYHQESRRCERLGVTGGLVGAIPHLSYRQQTARLAPGDILALFTDGVTEAARARGPEDDEGVAMVVQKHAADAAVPIARAILERANELANGELVDDVAIVVVRR